MAVGVLVQCHRSDAKMTQTMLHLPTPIYGNKDCIEVGLGLFRTHFEIADFEHIQDLHMAMKYILIIGFICSPVPT